MHRRKTVLELKDEFLQMRTRLGRNAEDSGWLVRNGYKQFYYQVHIVNGLAWIDWLSMNGIQKQSMWRRKYSREKLIDEFVSIYSAHGHDAITVSWLFSNGHRWLYSKVNRLGISWADFIKLCRPGIVELARNKNNHGLDNHNSTC
jgi:hypothetical protein